MGPVKVRRMLAATVLVAGALLLTVELPAGAASNTDNKTAQITFIDQSGAGVTCSITVNSTHNTDQPGAPYAAASVFLVPNGNDACVDTVQFVVDIDYKSKDGATHTAGSTGFGGFQAFTLQINDAYSPIHFQVWSTFYRCDTNRSASCLLKIDTAPK